MMGQIPIDWEIARRELKRCLTEEKSRTHSAFKLAQIKQKPNENLRIFILRYQDLHAATTGKTAAEDTDPTHIIRFLGMMTVINLIFTCLINYILFDCNDEGRKLRWSLKEFNLT